MKVLIIDDEPLIRRALALIAQTKGHQVALAEDGRQGLYQWRQFQPDLVFLDVFIPMLNGPSVLKQVKRGHEKVVMISARRNWEDSAGTDLRKIKGVDLFISKPFSNIQSIFSQAEALCDG